MINHVQGSLDQGCWELHSTRGCPAVSGSVACFALGGRMPGGRCGLQACSTACQSQVLPRVIQT